MIVKELLVIGLVVNIVIVKKLGLGIYKGLVIVVIFVLFFCLKVDCYVLRRFFVVIDYILLKYN